VGVERLGQIIYGTHEMEPCIAFYRDAVGLKFKFRDGDRWAAFDCGAVTFALSGENGGGRRSSDFTGSGGVAAFRVDDIHAFAQRLVAHGVKDTQVVEGGHELRLEVSDPSGNALIFYQSKPAPSLAGS
jgi:catechol 2,3-dioxygenase-like lactoylglutathione lyase family enzyme